MTHYCEVFWGIFLSFLRRYSRLCVVGYRLFFQVWYVCIYNIYVNNMAMLKITHQNPQRTSDKRILPSRLNLPEI